MTTVTSVKPATKIYFLKSQLILWAEKNLDDFPWRVLKKKLTVWEVAVGEVLLQRTPAERVLKVYEKLIKLCPNPSRFLKLSKEEVLTLLKPLGLQNKKYECLRELAKVLEKKNFEKTKFIGKFTANAVSLFGLNAKTVFVDEVVGRILWRYLFGRRKPPTSRYSNLKELWAVLENLSERSSYEEVLILQYALLDFARKVCKRRPLCEACCISFYCSYFSEVF